MLPRDKGRGIPEAQVPKAARPAPNPADPRIIRGNKKTVRWKKEKLQRTYINEVEQEDKKREKGKRRT